MTPRKPISQLSPQEAEKQREYMREAKANSRAGKPPEKDKRGYRDRAEYQRERRKKIKYGNSVDS